MTHDEVTAAKATVHPLGAAQKSSVVVEHFVRRLNAQWAQRTERQKRSVAEKCCWATAGGNLAATGIHIAKRPQMTERSYKDSRSVVFGNAHNPAEPGPSRCPTECAVVCPCAARKSEVQAPSDISGLHRWFQNRRRLRRDVDDSCCCCRRRRRWQRRQRMFLLCRQVHRPLLRRAVEHCGWRHWIFLCCAGRLRAGQCPWRYTQPFRHNPNVVNIRTQDLLCWICGSLLYFSLVCTFRCVKKQRKTNRWL